MAALLEESVNSFDTKPRRVLIADDQPAVLDALRLLLKREGYEIEAASAPEAVLAALETGPFDVLLMDLNYARDTTSGKEGLDLVGRVQAIDDTLPIVVMTAWSTVPLAVEAMRRGVRNFVEKPWDNANVLRTLREEMERARLERRRRQRTEEEQADARQTERGLLPPQIPEVPGFEIWAVWQPASVLSGDYFDARQLDDQLLALSIADVAGKGTPAALLVSNLQAAVRVSGGADVLPAELCRRVNRVMRGNIGPEKFITFFYAVLDGPARRLTYSNAGHNAPMLVRGNGSVIRLHEGGLVLGLSAEAEYEQARVALQPGDRLVLFTDGLTEARNLAGEEFGEEQLVDVIVRNPGLAAQVLGEKVLEAAGRFSRGFEDDLTLVVVKAVVSG